MSLSSTRGHLVSGASGCLMLWMALLAVSGVLACSKKTASSDPVERVEGYSEVLEELAGKVGQLDTKQAYVAFLNQLHDILEPMSAVSLTLLDTYQSWLNKPFKDHPEEVQRLRKAYLRTMKALFGMHGPLSKSLFARDAEATKVWKKLGVLEAKVKRHALVRKLWMKLIRIRDAATVHFFGRSR